MTELFTRHAYLESVPFGLRVRRLTGTDQLKIEFDDGTEDIFLDPAEAKSLHAMLGDLLGAEPERSEHSTMNVDAGEGSFMFDGKRIFSKQRDGSVVFTLDEARSSLDDVPDGKMCVVLYQPRQGPDVLDNTYVVFKRGSGIIERTKESAVAWRHLVGAATPERPEPQPEPLKPIYSWKEPGFDGEFFAAIMTDSYGSLPSGSHYARAYPSGAVRIYRKGTYDVNIHAKDYDDAIAKLRQLTQ